MRILMSMFGWGDSGGGTIFPRQLALELRRRGHEVMVIYAAVPRVPGGPDYGIHEHEEEGVRLVGIHNRPALFTDEQAPLREVRDPEAIKVFRHFFDAFQPDLVHYHNFLGLSLGIAEVAHRAGVPSLYTPYNFWLLCPTLYLNLPDLALCRGVNGAGSNCLGCTRASEPGSAYVARRDLLREGYAEMVGPCLATSGCVRDLMLENGYASEQIRIVRLGNDRAQRLWEEVGRDRVPGVAGPLRIGFVGALLPIKGVHTLVAAAQQLQGEFEVVLHGEGPADYVNYLRQLDARGVVRFAGRFADADHGRLLVDLHVGVVPSICYDHSPLVIGEFQAARVPVVGARIGGIPDYLQAGAGRLFEAGDVAGLAASLQGLIDEPSQVVQWQGRLDPPLAFDAYVDTLERHYAEALQGPAVAPPPSRSQTMKINLGCGSDHLPGWLNVDKFAEAKPDRVMDLEALPWPLPDNCAEEVLLKHVLEHLGKDSDTFLGIMKELYRICAPGATVRILVPHPRHQDFLQDPTHVRPITPELFHHFSYTVNQDWQSRGLPGTPLAMYLGLDFDIASSTLSLDPHWHALLQNDPAKRGELEHAIRSYNNVVQEVEVILRAVKPFRGQAAPTPSTVRSDAPQVAWEGTWFAYHSLSKINRELGRRLLDRGIDLSPIPYEPDLFDPSVDPRYRELCRRVGHPAPHADLHVRHQWPPKWEAPLSGKWVLIQPWEFGVIPKEWMAPLTRVDEVWVPSEFVKRAYTLGGVDPAKVVVIPNGVDADLFRPEGPRFPLKTKKTFKVLFVGGTIIRKGIDILLKAWKEAFDASSDVCLVLKGNPKGQVYNLSDIDETLQALRDDVSAAEIEYLPEDLDEAAMASLYRSCDVLVLPSRGEGFGIPLIEAMASGIPVIAPEEGPTREICTADCAIFLPSERMLVDRVDAFHAAAGNFWLEEPSRPALVSALKELAASPDLCRRMGAHGRARVLEAFTWEHMAAATEARIRALTGHPAPPATFLHTASTNGDWRAVLEAYLDAFQPGDPALLILDLRQGPPMTEVQDLLLTWAGRRGVEAFPDVAAVQPGEALEDVCPSGRNPVRLEGPSARTLLDAAARTLPRPALAP